MQALTPIRMQQHNPDDGNDERPRVAAAPAQKPPRTLRLVKNPCARRETDLLSGSNREGSVGAALRGRPSIGRTPLAVEFPFLTPHATPSFIERLARELAEAVRAIRQDPAAFIRGIREGGQLSEEKKARTRTGITVAIVIYAAALSLTYVSYRMFHSQKPRAEQHPAITYVASVPTPVRRIAAPLKEPGVRTSKDALKVPTVPAEQPKAGSTEARPTPRPPAQTITGNEPPAPPPATPPATAPATPYAPASETASRDSAPDGAARGQTGNGVGTAPLGGRGGPSSAEVNYNEIFTISKVTTRPQILARPVPGYTDEARRAHVEGAVKLSVVLNANGTVSDVKVTQPLGHGLDEKAIEAARQLRFVPAQRDGHTVSVRVFLEFKFTLL